MRYQSLLLSSLLVTIIALPALPLFAKERTTDIWGEGNKQVERESVEKLQRRNNASITSAYARMSAGMEGKNVNQAYAYSAFKYKQVDDKGKAINLQQAKQATTKFFQNISNYKHRYKVESIRYSGQSAIVSGTVYESGFVRSANNSFSGQTKFQDTWIQTSNGWKITIENTLSSNITWATPKRQANPTRKSSHDLTQASNLADRAIDECVDGGNLEACNRLNQIQSTLSTWCNQGDREACSLYYHVTTMEGIRRNLKEIREI